MNSNRQFSLTIGASRFRSATVSVALRRVSRRTSAGVALVVTLLLLSVITFLAVAFLAMSRRNQAAVSASLDVAAARAMSDAAQARAQVEITAQILAHGDPLYYDYMVSRDYISPTVYNDSSNNIYNPNNVNYDFELVWHFHQR